MESSWKLKLACVWGGELVSVLTSSILQMGFVWHITLTTNSASMLSLASLAGFLPLALFGTFAGTIVDRLPLKVSLIGADLFIAAVSAVVAATALYGVATFVAGLLGTGGFVAFLAMSFLMGLSSPFYSGPQTALMQEKVPPEYLGRVFGLYGAIMSWAMPLGLAFSSLFADAVGAPAWFVGAGAAMVLLACVTWAIPAIRRIEE